ncbi:hypothetical protein BIW11_00484, partial [Tropilaelaps mercedesae]
MFGTKKNKKGQSGGSGGLLSGVVGGGVPGGASACGNGGSGMTPLGGAKVPLSLQGSTPSISSQDDVNGNSVQLTAQQILDALPDSEVERRFKEMLEDMNIKSEESLLTKTIEKKRMMLSMRETTGTTVRGKLETPFDFVQCLRNEHLSSEKLLKHCESLRIALTSNPLSWVKEFIDKGGTDEILTLVRKCQHNKKFSEKNEIDLIRCFRAAINNGHGTKYVKGNSTALQTICGSLRPDRPSLMLEAVRLIAPLAIIEGGQSDVLSALTLIAEQHGIERFRAIVEGLESDQDALRKHCLQLVNVLLEVEDYDFRVHLRNEFMRCGMLNLYEKMLKEEHMSVDLSRQFTVFKNSLEDDLDELTQKYENIAQDFFDLKECFDMIKASVTGTPSASAFLSILQHLLLIRDDAQIRPAYYKLIDGCIAQIVLHRNGLDPDFGYTQKFQMNVEELVERVKGHSSGEDINIEALQNRLEEALTQKQEMEAKLANYEAKIGQMSQGSPGKALQVPAGLLKGQGIGPPPGATSSNGGVSGAPPPPPPPPPSMTGIGGKAFISPASLLLGGASLLSPLPPAMPGSDLPGILL